MIKIIIIILESIGSLKMNIKDCENLWDLWRFVIEKLNKEEYWYSWMIKIIIILESIGSIIKDIKDCENL